MLNLDRNSLRIATGLYTEHSVLNQHMHIMGLLNSTFCMHREGELETTFHPSCSTMRLLYSCMYKYLGKALLRLLGH